MCTGDVRGIGSEGTPFTPVALLLPEFPDLPDQRNRCRAIHLPTPPLCEFRMCISHRDEAIIRLLGEVWWQGAHCTGTVKVVLLTQVGTTLGARTLGVRIGREKLLVWW
jgi:hypothetical protein